jgi:hypothetical protein
LRRRRLSDSHESRKLNSAVILPLDLLPLEAF